MNQPINKADKKRFENLKCKLCQKYLTVGPIFTVTQSGEDSKCGRCEDIKSNVLIRNFTYEKMLSNIDLPCFAGCDIKLRWGQVEQHEQICNYRTIQCIGCNNIVKFEEFEEHFKSEMKPDDNKFFTKAIENYSIPPYKSTSFLFKALKHSYIVVIHFMYHQMMYAAVYCLQNQLEVAKFDL